MEIVKKTLFHPIIFTVLLHLWSTHLWFTYVWFLLVIFWESYLFDFTCDVHLKMMNLFETSTYKCKCILEPVDSIRGLLLWSIVRYCHHHLQQRVSTQQSNSLSADLSSSGWTCDNTSVNSEKPSACWVALEGSALVDPLTTNRLNTWNRCLLGNIPLSFTLHFSISSHSTHNNYSNCHIPLLFNLEF